MKNKKGFTLAELLVVVALLGVVLLLVIPNVLKPFKASKESLFLDSVKTVLSSATTTYLMDTSLGRNFCKGKTTQGVLLNIEGEDVYYTVSVDVDGNVTSILVSNEEYTYSDTATKIKKKDIVESKITENPTNITCTQ